MPGEEGSDLYNYYAVYTEFYTSYCYRYICTIDLAVLVLLHICMLCNLCVQDLMYVLVLSKGVVMRCVSSVYILWSYPQALFPSFAVCAAYTNLITPPPYSSPSLLTPQIRARLKSSRSSYFCVPVVNL